MLRNKQDSLRDIPNDVRHSLQFLDNLLEEFDDPNNKTSVPTLRSMKKVPLDARKSLEILDNVLGEFEIGVEHHRSESADNLRIPSDVNEDVKKSIEALDQVLDEFQNTDGYRTFQRRQNLDGKGSLQRPRHDDIRRSLEVLDSVLAEFDDCLESWDSIAPDKSPRKDEYFRAFKNREPANDNVSLNSLSYDSQNTDGSTSHDSGLSLQEQVKVTSPPPVPKRSASTKLSDRNSGVFTFPSGDSQSFDSLPSDLATQDNKTSLSKSESINTLSAKDDDEVFKREDGTAKIHCCVKCGKEITLKEHAMEKKVSKDASSSPFSERRKLFEDNLGDSRINVSPLLERSFTGSSFKVKAGRTKECESEPSSLIFYKSSDYESSESSHSSFASKYSPKATKVTPPTVGALLSLPNNPYHAPNCNCKEKIRQLQIKFAETRRLLKANKIRGLDTKPPSFVPPPPPPEVIAKNARNELHVSKNHLSNGFSENAAISDSNSFSASNGSLNSESLNSEMSENSSLPDSEKNPSNLANTVEQKLCSKCSASEPTPISETIEDIPNLLPTDALKRPHLGLSYCMEDDFCPGVKEILQTSIPRNGVPLSKNNKMNSLSTFSLSDSSLGYVSSQSDLELSNSPYKAEKVPVSSVKFSTLPEGMGLHSLPSYYGHNETAKNGHHKIEQPLYRDRNFNHTTDPQLRSSSAPPLPEPEKPKKKHFRGFSRKDKKDKKNEDNISVTSYLSLDDGVILRAVDGDTSNKGASDNSRETGVEKKRWSALRSLLGKR